MAISVGTVTGCWGITELSGPRPTHTIAGHEFAIEAALVSVNHNDQVNAYLQADGCTFDASAVLTARTGHMCIPFNACCVESGVDDGTMSTGGPCTAGATPGLIHCHIYVEDCATEKDDAGGVGAAWAAPNTWTKDVVYCVTYLKLIQ
jgi:hypothetical protein